MTKVFFSVGMSLDGYMAPEGMDAAHMDDPTYMDWLNRWSALQEWVFRQEFFRRNLHLGPGGETGADNRLLEETYARTGVTVLGRRMFDAGERSWPEEAPFHTPVIVVTHRPRAPWSRPGGTTFYFVTEGIESALRQALGHAGDRDVRIGGGGATLVQFLNAGLVDEFHIAVAPVLFGGGVRLFEGIDPRAVGLELVETVPSSKVTHLKYRVLREGRPT